MKLRAQWVFGILFLGVLSTIQPVHSKEPIKYFILAGTMEPLMILRPGDPMAGGMFTEIVKKVFDGSPYDVQALVMPWKRMTGELRRRGDWIMHGIPAFFEPDIPYKLSKVPVFPFNHVAVTLNQKNFKIRDVRDLTGRTVILVENYHYPGLDAHLDKPLVGTSAGVIRSVRAFKPAGTLKMLKHKRGDVVIGFQPRLLYNLKSAGLSAADVRFQDASGIVPTQQMFVAYSPRLPTAFGQFVNRRLRQLTDNGEIGEILDRYYAPVGVPRIQGASK